MVLTNCWTSYIAVILAMDDEVILSSNHFVMCSLYAAIQGARVVFADEENYKTRVDDLLGRVSAAGQKWWCLPIPTIPTGTYL